MASPITTVIFPLSGATITQFQKLLFRVTDADDDIATVLVSASFSSVLADELVHNGTTFEPRYAKLSVREIITNGFQYTLIREGGWPISTMPEFNVVAAEDPLLLLVSSGLNGHWREPLNGDYNNGQATANTGMTKGAQPNQLDLVDGDQIQDWFDQSGADSNARRWQVGAGSGPTYHVNQQNGLPILRSVIGARGDMSQIVTTYINTAIEGEVYQVCKSTTAGNVTNADLQFHHRGFQPVSAVSFTDSMAYIGFVRQTARFSMAEFMAGQGMGLFNVSSSASATIVRWNGAIVGSFGAGTIRWDPSAFTIGGNAVFFSGIDRGELALYDRILTAGERAQNESYFNTKWALGF